jgi:hypothetical protein
MVTQRDVLDIQKALLVTPKTEPATQQAAIITQTTQFVNKMAAVVILTFTTRTLRCSALGSSHRGSGCDKVATSLSAQRSDQGLEPDAAPGRVLMNDVIYMASGRRQALLVMELWFDTRFSNADAVGVFCVHAVRHIVHVSRLWLLLLAIWREFRSAGQIPAAKPEVTSKTLFGRPETRRKYCHSRPVSVCGCPSDRPHPGTGAGNLVHVASTRVW